MRYFLFSSPDSISLFAHAGHVHEQDASLAISPYAVIAVIVLLPVIGAVVYLLISRSRKSDGDKSI